VVKSNRKRKQETKEQADPFLIEMVDRLPFVAPVGAAQSFEQRWTLAIAAAAAAKGSTLMAMALISRVQRELGVSISDQVAAIERAAERVGRQIRAKAERARDAEIRRAEALNGALKAAAPDEKLRALTEACEARLAEANAARLQMADAKGGERAEIRKTVKTALAALRVAQAELDAAKAAKADAAWSKSAVTETVVLETARDAEADVIQGERQPVRVRTRDGLALLFEKGTITENEWRAGRGYRALVESAAGISSQMGSGAAVSAGALALLAVRRAQRLERLRKIERIVYLGTTRAPEIDRKTGQPKLDRKAMADGNCRLEILRAVAGEGKTIRACASGGQARLVATEHFLAAIKLLVEALWKVA
jgi:hypothetical protein